jgi:hypothetical protein
MLLAAMRDIERCIQNLAFLSLTARHYLSKELVAGCYCGCIE